MRYPSVKTIERGLGIEHALAVKVRELLDGRLDPATVPETAAWIRQCYHMPSLAELKMHAVDAVLGNYGVEGFSNGRVSVAYSNTGDTYAPTIVRCTAWRDRYAVASWGDTVESLERRGIRFE